MAAMQMDPNQEPAANGNEIREMDKLIAETDNSSTPGMLTPNQDPSVVIETEVEEGTEVTD